MGRTGHRSHGYIAMMVDDSEDVEYVRKGKKRHRKYSIMLHRNNYTKVHWAGYGYWKDGAMKWLWSGTGRNNEDLREKLWQKYHLHRDVLTGMIRLVKIDPSLTRQGCVPGTKDDSQIPEYLMDSWFRVVKRHRGEEFDMTIESPKGERYTVSSDCMKKVRHIT